MTAPRSGCIRLQLELPTVREAQSTLPFVDPAVIARSFVQEAQVDRECFWVVHLNTRNLVVERELVSVGTVRCALVHPREVFKKAIMNGATAIVTVHNHPSGSIVPSSEDHSTWTRLDQAGEIIGIQVLDHLIIAPSDSFYARSRAS